jgi:hypothetical protein
MKCFILGAGASFGYDETLIDIEKPPLTRDVFRRGHQLGFLTSASYPRLYDRLLFYLNNHLGLALKEPTVGIDAEEFLGWLAEEFERRSQPLSQPVQDDKERTRLFQELNSVQGALGEAWYFLFELIRHYSISYKPRFDAYRRLALHYFDSPYSAVSLNYDTIFESAILSAGLTFSYFDRTPLTIPLAKVHGSVSWLNPIGRGIAVGGLTSSNVLQTVAPFIYSNRINMERPRFLDIRALHNTRVKDLLRSGTDYDEPILLPPIGSHKDYEKVELYRQIWAFAERMIAEATELVFVGTTLRKQDVRLCQAIGKNLKEGTKVVIVRGKDKVIATLSEILPWRLPESIEVFDSFLQYTESL